MTSKLPKHEWPSQITLTSDSYCFAQDNLAVVQYPQVAAATNPDIMAVRTAVMHVSKVQLAETYRGVVLEGICNGLGPFCPDHVVAKLQLPQFFVLCNGFHQGCDAFCLDVVPAKIQALQMADAAQGICQLEAHPMISEPCVSSTCCIPHACDALAGIVMSQMTTATALEYWMPEAFVNGIRVSVSLC